PAESEDVAGGPRTAVLTDSFWRREFGGDRGVAGHTLVLDGRTYEIGGVMPADFHFPLLRQAEVLLPMAMEGRENEFRGMYWVMAVARLKPGAGVREAQAELDVSAPRVHAKIAEHAAWTMEAQPLLDDLVGPVKPALTALFGAVLLALLIACANVASLLLARGMARQRELAIRAALGAGRGALVRHLLVEAMVLATLGGLLAVVAAPWVLGALLSLAPPDMPRLEEVHIDAGVLVADLDLPLARYPDKRVFALARNLMERLQAEPGTRSAALMTSVPLDPRARSEFGFSLEGSEPYPPGQSPKAEILWATPGYLATIGIPLASGRDLARSDVKAAPHVVLVNEAFVRQLIPKGEPLGRRITELLGPGNDPWTIAGVIGDVHTKGLDRAPAPLMVVPLMQYPVPGLRVALRAASGEPMSLLAGLRADLAALDPDLPLSA